MNNPVAWQLWDAESIEFARKHNLMIFLSIGYSACHCTSTLIKWFRVTRLTAHRVSRNGKGVLHVL